MKIDIFFDKLSKSKIDYFAGVPDSLLKPFCDFLMSKYGIPSAHHIVAHNEGGCVALASGYHLATGRIPCVYMQNSGIGNIANPVISLTHPKVYSIPILYVVGWRGEPGTKDEPQHAYQGEITLDLLKNLALETYVVGSDTTEQELSEVLKHFCVLFAEGKSAAFVIRKNAFSVSESMKYKYSNGYLLDREDAIRKITQISGDDIVVSTTGKISRELFEIRAAEKSGHARDFLTVGSMGHSGMIALGIASNMNSDSRIWCIDGDGSLLMHMGCLGVIGKEKPKNFIHVVLNNVAHETVGGMPTVVETMNLSEIALASGYEKAFQVESEEELVNVLFKLKNEKGLIFVEVKVALGARGDLGRPTLSTIENKQNFMGYLKSLTAEGL